MSVGTVRETMTDRDASPDERDGEEAEEREGDGDEPDDGGHLGDVPDGAGCTEIWERLSERREE